MRRFCTWSTERDRPSKLALDDSAATVVDTSVAIAWSATC
jgi:hypothetical protein